MPIKSRLPQSNLHRHLLAGLSLFVAIGASLPAAAETRAVVVGIDKYLLAPLKGAVADADDIAGALRRRGVRDLVLLRNDDATRTSVLAAIDDVVVRTQKDDLVIISFAGHGVREVWGKSHPPGVREGDTHETFVLGKFAAPDSRGKIDTARGGSAAERIWGTEMNTRLAALDARGARTIFVADTCFSGGLTRQPLLASGYTALPTRMMQPFVFAEGQDPLAKSALALTKPVDTDTALTNLTFLAAVDETRASPEVRIPKEKGQPRGALSYAFARVIDGSASSAQPGIFTRGDLVDYIGATVRPLTDNQQDPDLRPRREFDRVVIDATRDLGPPTGASAAPSTSASTDQAIKSVVRIFSSGATSVEASKNGSVEIVAATTIEDSDISWNSNTRQVFSKGGDLVASDIGAKNLAGVALREAALRRLTALAATKPRAIRLANGNRRHVLDEKIDIDIAPANEAATPTRPEHYVLFNVAGTGKVQFLYPYLDKGDKATIDGPRPFDKIVVRPPFGADMLVLVVAEHPLDGLVAKLRALDGTTDPLSAVAEIERALTPDCRIGIQQLFTYATAE